MTQTLPIKYKRLLFYVFVFFFYNNLYSQLPQYYNTSDILLRLEKLKVLGSVLYVAAHPDDENTSAIAYFANGKLIRTGYLSATRGDGGQNLIGPEIRESLGIIRTQELLAARKVDHGEQFFSRAVDFGYSKHPDETFDKWDKEKVLSDFVRVFRSFRPDVVITRFNTQPGVTHGHHTASAILANEAFKLSGDPTAFPDQLEELTPWQPKKIFWNTSWWFYRRTGQEFDPDGLSRVNVGEYSPVLGKSFTEISAQSRSMHKSQGFGVAASRGDEFEYFINQDSAAQKEELFDGIDMSWGRVEGAEDVAYFIQEANENFDPENPHYILEELISARKELINLPDQYWKQVKLEEIDELILAVTGTFIKLTTSQELFALGDSIAVTGELINRSPAKVTLSSIDFNLGGETFLFNLNLNRNQVSQMNFNLTLPEDFAISQPYWLTEAGTDGMFIVTDHTLIGDPQNKPAISARVTLKVDNQFIDYNIPVWFNKADPVEGEIYRPIHITPKVMVSSDQEVIIFGDNKEKSIRVNVLAGRNNIDGKVFLKLPNGWKSTPESYSFSLKAREEERQFSFKVTPSKDQGQFDISVLAEVEGELYHRGIKKIDYDHIPPQVLFPEAVIKASRIDLKTSNHQVGYIMGAGDLVPQSLEQIGYQVDLLDEGDISMDKLRKYDAIILGVRAFNTVDWLAMKNVVLFDYVKEGGNLIVQYNTSHRLVTENIAPFDLKLSRDRVTVEESQVTFLDRKDPVLNTPNKISDADFEGWVQERGLYFPGSWGDELKPVLSMKDPGEPSLDGGLLVGKYGSGYYMYTGLSFFRELPAGVPGAYRLFANLISIGTKKEQ